MKAFLFIILVSFLFAMIIEFPVFSLLLILLVLILNYVIKIFKGGGIYLKGVWNEVLDRFYNKLYKGFIYEINYAILYGNSLNELLSRYNKLNIRAKIQVAIGVVESITSSCNYDMRLSDLQYSNVQEFVKRFNLNRYGIVTHPSFEKLVKLFVINDLIAGNVSERIEIPSFMKLIKLDEDDVVLWVFDKVTCSSASPSNYPFADDCSNSDKEGLMFFTDKFILFSSDIINEKIIYNDIVDVKDYGDVLKIYTKKGVMHSYRNLDVDFSRRIINFIYMFHNISR